MSNTFGAPGVYITESLLAPTPVITQSSPSVAGFAGEHWRGPVNVPIQCNKWLDFVNYFGGFNPSATPVLANKWLPYAVYEFFANGGTQCYVSRIGCVATPGTAASHTFVDGAATPQNTLRLTAGVLGLTNSMGTWGNSIWAQISVPTGATAGTFTLTVYYGGLTPANIVEQWTNLTMLNTSPRYAPTVLNSATSGSLWVFATDLNSPTAAPGNAPAAVGPVQFTSGADLGDPTTTSNGDYANAFTYGLSNNTYFPNGGCFDSVPGIINMNAPGVTTTSTSTTVMTALIGYATGNTSTGRPYTFLVLDPPPNSTVASVTSYMQTLQGLDNSSFAALYYPWVIASNPATSALQSTLDMPPGGFILGQYSSMDTNQGPWYAPAGTTTVLNNVVQTESVLSPSSYATLNLANVNALKTLPNGQVIIWGARTMLTVNADVYVPIRRTLNYIESRLSQLLQFAIFQPNDSILWATITSTCDQLLSQLAAKNAFAGTTQAQQYFVTCNATNNTPTTISQGVVNTTIGIALNYPAEFLQLNIQQFQTNGATTVTAG